MALNFTYMNENDLYNADRVCNDNFHTIAANVMEAQMLTKAAYDALSTKSADKFYAVIDGSKASLYLGELPISTGEVLPVGTMTAELSGTNESIYGNMVSDEH